MSFFFFLLQHKSHVYRDRAAERRALHGGFGEAPGQKRSIDEVSPPTEEAAAEALEMSLGTGSYAQKLLKNMGWKEVTNCLFIIRIMH